MLGSRIITIVAGLITAAMINRSLGPSSRGVYAEMQTWVGLFIILFGMSMDTAIYHFSNKSLYSDDDQSKLFTIFSLSLIYGFLATGALTIFVTTWPQRVSPETLKYLILLDVLLITTMLVGNLLIYLQAIERIQYSAIIGVVQGVTNLLVVGYAYWADLLDVKMVLWSVLMVQGVAIIMLLFEFRQTNLLGGKFSKKLAKGILAAGMKQHIATISTFVYTKINQLIVFKYCGESETGFFSVSLNAAFYLMFIPMTFQTVLYPRVIRSTDDYEITIRSLKLGFYSWGMIVTLMIIFAKPILLIYAGPEFLKSVNNFRILMVAAWFLPLSSMVAPYYIKLGAFGFASLTAVLLGLLSMGLNFFLVPKYTTLGASIATTLTCLFGFTMVLGILRHLSSKNPLVLFYPDFKKEIAYLKIRFFGGVK